jgi:EAL domain-containing protein (putative c-di-GMP-specific phosphodiesterase class I)
MIQFERLISEGGVIPFFQPIVRMDDRITIAYEVLGRSRLFGLSTPHEMFAAAHQLNQVFQLSDMFRMLGASTAQQHKLESNLFLNTHPDEIGNHQLLASLQVLRSSYPNQSFTLEIHERAVTQSGGIKKLRSALDDLSIQLAFDDFGEGQTRLVELSEANPDYIKFDKSLTQNISAASFERQKVLSVMARMVNELGMCSLAEGVETQEDHEVLAQMGFQLGQGFLYGRPLSISKYAQPKAE